MIESDLLAIGVLIVGTKLAEGIFHRFGINSFIAYTVAGVVLGPVTNLVELSSGIHLWLGVGVFVFFFLVGLDEIDIPGFLGSMRGRFIFTAMISIIISLFSALAVTSNIFSFGLGLDLKEALIVAGILSLSSLGIVAKVLGDEGRLKDRIGIQIFTVVLISELVVLLVIGFAVSIGSVELTAGFVLTVIGGVMAFAIIAWILSSIVLPRLIVLLERLLNVPQLPFGLLIGGLFIMVELAEEFNFHGSLGALLFGAGLAGLPYQVRHDIMPGMRGIASGLFVPLFFASAGLHLDLSFLDFAGWTVAALVAIPLLGNLAGAFISAYVTRVEAPVLISLGLTAKGVAEIAFLVVFLESGIIDQSLFSLLVIIMFGYILLTPQALKFALSKMKVSGSVSADDNLPPSLAHFTLSHVKVSDVLNRERTYPDLTLSVRGFVDRWTTPHQNDYVIGDKGALAGIVSLSMLRYLPKSEWSTTSLSNVLRRRKVHAWSDELVEDVLQRMTENSLTTLPVLDRESEEFLGSITSHEILSMMLVEAKGGTTPDTE